MDNERKVGFGDKGNNLIEKKSNDELRYLAAQGDDPALTLMAEQGDEPAIREIKNREDNEGQKNGKILAFPNQKGNKVLNFFRTKNRK
jgi:hypothetical protein